MIRLGHQEFFIEPLDQRTTGAAEEEEAGGEHIVYRSSAIIRKHHPPAVNRSAGDFIRGEKMVVGRIS